MLAGNQNGTKDRGLTEILSDHSNWNKERMNCFVDLFVALLQTRTVNLVELASVFNSAAQIDSRYKRIQRFFSPFGIDMAVGPGCAVKMPQLLADVRSEKENIAA